MLIAPNNRFLNLLGWRPTGDLGGLTGYTSKRGRGVWFLKAPPKEPPTDVQRHCRNKFRLAAFAWTQLDDQARAAWTSAQDLAHMNITGYNLFIYWQLTKDEAAIRTIEHQTGLVLLHT